MKGTYDKQPFGGAKLPPPLTTEKEIMLLKNPSEKSRNQLIEHNLRLVVLTARKFSNTGIELEDLISIGTIGLIKAVNTFSIEKNIKLSTYVSRCIENEILMHLRHIKKHKDVLSLDEPFMVDIDGNESPLQDFIPDEKAALAFSTFENRELASSIYHLALKSLSSKDFSIFLYTVDGKTQEQIGKLMKMSQSYISRRQRKIFQKLRNLLKK